MLKLYTDMKPVPVDMRVAIMQKHIAKGGIPVDYDRLLEHYAHHRIRASRAQDIILSTIGSTETKLTDNIFKDFLFKRGYTDGLTLTPKGDLSLGEESVNSFLKTNAYSEGIMRLMSVYRTYSEANGTVTQLPAVLKGQTQFTESSEGRRIVLVKPKVTKQNTGRFGFTDPGLMNWPRSLKDCFKAPKGWKLVSADSRQIEPMIIYNLFIKDPQISKLIELYRDAYYAVLHYCTMPHDFITNGRMDFELFEITPELKEKRDKLKTYGNAVMYGSTSNSEKDPLKDAFISRIGKHPKRILWQEQLEKQLAAGQREFPTVFGTMIDVYKSKKYFEAKTQEERDLALAHCIINNPVQGTGGDLMGFSLRASDKVIEQRAQNSWIVKFVHDEGMYCIYEREYDDVMEDLAGNTSYLIDDKLLIGNDRSYCDYINEDVPYSYPKRGGEIAV